ncbi:MAG: class I SAM-dependent methyltransferase [Myxococcaceae bacterium]|nr:class I SAM-dependent methyltransferase [Myxococcaceae bacterium]
MSHAQSTGYDTIADVYDVLWGEVSTRRYLTAVLGWLRDAAAPGATVLDLACGTGQLAAALRQHHFDVAGIDVSPAMIARARTRVPDARFEVGDLTALPFPPASFDAAVSLFDSLNHLTPSEFPVALAESARVLRPGGVLLFDLNTDEGFRARWKGSSAEVRDDLVCATRVRYDAERGEGEYLITAFRPRPDGAWSRTDAVLHEWAHPEPVVRAALAQAGFEEVEVVASDTALGLTSDRGRSFYRCRRGARLKP